jgi:hypothetical protein
MSVLKKLGDQVVLTHACQKCRDAGVIEDITYFTPPSGGHGTIEICKCQAGVKYRQFFFTIDPPVQGEV